MATATKTEHPYVTRQEGICGGSPIVAGRRIPVWQIAVALRDGRTAEDIVRAYRGRLTPAAVHDAISYYYDHRDDVERDIWLNTSDDALDQQLQSLGGHRDGRGVIRFGADSAAGRTAGGAGD